MIFCPLNPEEALREISSFIKVFQRYDGTHIIAFLTQRLLSKDEDP